MAWLADLYTRVRHWTDEPATNAKFTDAKLYDLVRSSYARLFPDIMANDEGSFVVRHDITLVDNQQVYVLPPNVGTILRLAQYDADTDIPTWELLPDTLLNPTGYGFTIEGNTIRLLQRQAWDGEVLRLLYIPNGESKPHTGVTNSGGSTVNAIELATSPTAGTLDLRPNAYAGCFVRLTGGTSCPYEERYITAYDNSTRLATVSPAFTVAPVSMNYDIIPSAGVLLEDVLSVAVARRILAIDGHTERKQLMDGDYREACRALRLQLAKIQMRVKGRYDGRVPSNTDYVTGNNFWGILV